MKMTFRQKHARIDGKEIKGRAFLFHRDSRRTRRRRRESNHVRVTTDAITDDDARARDVHQQRLVPFVVPVVIQTIGVRPAPRPAREVPRGDGWRRLQQQHVVVCGGARTRTRGDAANAETTGSIIVGVRRRAIADGATRGRGATRA